MGSGVGGRGGGLYTPRRESPDYYLEKKSITLYPVSSLFQCFPVYAVFAAEHRRLLIHWKHRRDIGEPFPPRGFQKVILFVLDRGRKS